MDTFIGGILTNAKLFIALGILVCFFELFLGAIYLIDTFVHWHYSIKHWRRCRKAAREIKNKHVELNK